MLRQRTCRYRSVRPETNRTPPTGGLGSSSRNGPDTAGSSCSFRYRLGGVPQIVQPVSLAGTPALNLLLLVINSAIALGRKGSVHSRRGLPDRDDPGGRAGNDHLLRHRFSRRPGPPGSAQWRTDDHRAEYRLRVDHRCAQRLNGIPGDRESGCHGEGMIGAMGTSWRRRHNERSKP